MKRAFTLKTENFKNGGKFEFLRIRRDFKCKLNVFNDCIMNYDDQNIGNDYNNTTFYIVLSDRFVR